MDIDPLDLSAQEAARKDAELQDKLKQKTDADDVKWLMSSKRGRRIVWRSIERAGVFRLSFSTDAMAMAFAEGCKNEGLRTLALINAACPELYQTMLKEAVE